MIFLAVVFSGLGAGNHRAAAQAASPAASCALVPTAEVAPLAGNSSVSEGLPASLASVNSNACRYTWGEGVGRYKLDVSTSDPKQVFGGMSPEMIKQHLQAVVTPATSDAVIADVGDIAVFKADSPAYVHATAVVKGRVLQIALDGYNAAEQKDQVIALLKSAASRM